MRDDNDNEEHVSRSSVVDNDQLKVLIESAAYKCVSEVAEELHINQSTVVQHLKQIGELKKLDKGVLHELGENRKLIVSIQHLLFYCLMKSHRFSIG